MGRIFYSIGAYLKGIAYELGFSGEKFYNTKGFATERRFVNYDNP